MALRPVRDKILVKVIEDNEQTSGGIFIPDSAKEKPQKGEITAVGEGKMTESGVMEPMPFKVGQTILYTKYAGTELKYEGVEYRVLQVKDILAIIE